MCRDATYKVQNASYVKHKYRPGSDRIVTNSKGEQSMKAKAMTKIKGLPVGRGKVGYTTSNVYRTPLKKVWEAATRPEHLTKHFVDRMKGEFDSNLDPVTWEWKDFGEWTFQPISYKKEKELVFLAPDWSGKYLIKVRFEFVRKDGKTIFRVHELGYPSGNLQQAFMNCEGWTEFHTGIKAYLKWGADLRKL
jgi:uncharacterized protein YndB with AHSA1/START domain